MREDILFSTRCVLATVPEEGHRCPLCKSHDKVRKGTQAYKFAAIDPKDVTIRYAYAHLSCADKLMVLQPDEEAPFTDEQMLKIWDGVEALMNKRAALSGAA